jgi:hypothetical protein
MSQTSSPGRIEACICDSSLRDINRYTLRPRASIRRWLTSQNNGTDAALKHARHTNKLRHQNKALLLQKVIDIGR